MNNWALIESDFLREYGLDLRETLALDWRRFTRLLKGLAAESRFMMLVRHHQETEPLESDEAERLLAAHYGGG